MRTGVNPENGMICATYLSPRMVLGWPWWWQRDGACGLSAAHGSQPGVPHRLVAPQAVHDQPPDQQQHLVAGGVHEVGGEEHRGLRPFEPEEREADGVLPEEEDGEDEGHLLLLRQPVADARGLAQHEGQPDVGPCV